MARVLCAPFLSPGARRVDYVAGNGSAAVARAIVRYGCGRNPRRSFARMAAAPAHEPARSRVRGGDFHPAPELHRNGPLDSFARHGAPPGGTPRRAAA